MVGLKIYTKRIANIFAAGNTPFFPLIEMSSRELGALGLASQQIEQIRRALSLVFVEISVMIRVQFAFFLRLAWITFVALQRFLLAPFAAAQSVLANGRIWEKCSLLFRHLERRLTTQYGILLYGHGWRKPTTKAPAIRWHSEKRKQVSRSSTQWSGRLSKLPRSPWRKGLTARC